MLSIKNLQASIEDKEILKGINLEVQDAAIISFNTSSTLRDLKTKVGHDLASLNRSCSLPYDRNMVIDTW